MPTLISVRPDTTGRILSLHWDDGSRSRFHAVWLRDNCPCPDCRHPGNGQRLFTVAELPEDIRIDAAMITDGALELRFEPGHRSRFGADWLHTHRYDEVRPQAAGWLDPCLETWDRGLARHPPRGRWPVLLESPEALAEWLALIHRYGFALLDDCGVESGTVCRVAERFGHVRETNYGRWFEVRSEINPVNLAYTGLGLQVHTDNPYRDPVPGLQLLHCLTNDAIGGDSIVVDGFHAARLLRDESPKDFATLTHWPVPFEYRSSDAWLRAAAPLIELAPTGELLAVRFNNRSLAAPRIPLGAMPGFYAAYRRFAEILERPELHVRFKLEPGQLFIVDNRRVLHGRDAFSGSGSRHLQGCYADRGGLLSTLAVLREVV